MSMFDGEKVKLEDMLQAKEERVRKIKLLLKDSKCVLSFKLNIPGEIKNNAMIQKIFESGVEAIFDSELYKDTFFRQNVKTGPELFCSYGIPPVYVKNIATRIENMHKLGRIFDIDVVTKDKAGELVYLSRRDTDRKEQKRKCYICENNAIDCARNRTHDINEILKHIESMLLV